MKITELSINHFLGVTAFKVTKTGKMNLITGKNGVGKSTVLKAIQEALKSSGVDPELIQVGQDKAQIFLRLDNGVEIEKTITPASNNVKVTDNGSPVSSPQRFLTSIIGKYSFNPVEFFLAKAAERRKLLLSVMPLQLDLDAIRESVGEIDTDIDWRRFDFTQHGLNVLAEIQRHVYERRHDQGVTVTRLKKAIEQDTRDIPETEDIERFKDFDHAAKLDALQQANDAMARHEGQVQRLAALREQDVALQGQVENLRSQIENLKAKLAELEADREQLRQTGMQLRTETDKFEAPPIAEMRQELDEYQAAQKLILKLDEIERKKADLAKEQGVHEELDRLHEIVKDDLPRRMFQSVKLPIENLSIDGDDIRVDGVSIDKLSTSEKMRFTVQVARVLASKLKIVCVDGFEALDPEIRATFVKQAAGDEFEYFIANVGEGPLKMQEMDAVE